MEAHILCIYIRLNCFVVCTQIAIQNAFHIMQSGSYTCLFRKVETPFAIMQDEKFVCNGAVTLQKTKLALPYSDWEIYIFRVWLHYR